MQRFYGVQLTDLVTGKLSWRRFGVLVHELPMGSRTVRAVLGDTAAWSTTEHLLANLVDIGQMSLWQQGGSKRAPKPRPIPRPGAKTGERRLGTRSLTTEAIDDLFAPKEAL